MNVEIKTIAHKDQAYETVGNYFTDPDGAMCIHVSDMGDDDYNMLVAIHELVEAVLCKKAGISDEEITKFDEAFEAARMPGDISEPGDDPAAPYGKQHCIATAVERLVCAELGVNWADYEKAVLAVSAP